VGVLPVAKLLGRRGLSHYTLGRRLSLSATTPTCQPHALTLTFAALGEGLVYEIFRLQTGTNKQLRDSRDRGVRAAG
jgi:hypothetical protein